MRLFSPGLAGGMWVSAVRDWMSVPEGRHWQWDVGQELSRVMLSDTAGTHGLSCRVEILKQAMIMKRVLGFSAFLFVFSFFSPFPPSFPLPFPWFSRSTHG